MSATETNGTALITDAGTRLPGLPAVLPVGERSAAFFAADGVPKLPFLPTRHQGQAAIRRLFDVADSLDFTGNLPPLPAIFMAPVVRQAEDGLRRLEMRRWGMRHWCRWLGPANRCLVPLTSFCEYADTKPRKTPTWFATAPTRPLTAT